MTTTPWPLRPWDCAPGPFSTPDSLNGLCVRPGVVPGPLSAHPPYMVYVPVCYLAISPNCSRNLAISTSFRS